jgi:hypothetical protein
MPFYTFIFPCVEGPTKTMSSLQSEYLDFGKNTESNASFSPNIISLLNLFRKLYHITGLVTILLFFEFVVSQKNIFNFQQTAQK